MDGRPREGRHLPHPAPGTFFRDFDPRRHPMSPADLPGINATLNAVSTVLLVSGWWCIRSGRKPAHVACMVTALATSAVFLACYLTYHAWLHETLGVRGIRFTHEGLVRPVYYAILVTHVFGAVVNLPMIILTVVPAVRRRFDRHRRIARWTLPVWLYVSVTGVVVYLMLYRWFPSEMLPLLDAAREA